MEKSALKLICIFCLCLLSISVRAQFMTDADGRPLLERRYTDVQGSPYMTDNWQKGTVKLGNGQVHKNVDLKYDKAAEQLTFKGKEGTPLTFIQPVKEFTLPMDNGTGVMVFRNGYKPVDDAASNTFYQVLSDGETALLKRSIKKVLENKPYNSATTVKTFADVNNYYLVKNGSLIKVKRDAKDILPNLTDYSAELQSFIKENKLNLKSEPALIMLITYYNSLK